MTREEAIERLNIHKSTDVFVDSIAEAIDMAIEALQILGDDGIVNCCGCIHWKTDGGAMMMCELWDTPMGDFDYCSYGKREKPTIPTFTESAEAYKKWTGEELTEQADRPHGEWIVREYCTNELDYRRWIEIECPFCGEKPTYEDLDYMNYCPNCGAIMTPYKGGDTK